MKTQSVKSSAVKRRVNLYLPVTTYELLKKLQQETGLCPSALVTRCIPLLPKHLKESHAEKQSETQEKDRLTPQEEADLEFCYRVLDEAEVSQAEEYAWEEIADQLNLERAFEIVVPLMKKKMLLDARRQKEEPTECKA